MAFEAPDVDRLRAALRARTAAPYTDEMRRQAAVLIPLFLRSDELHVVLTKRSESLRRHPGEVSFPGGGLDPGDASLEGAALREAWEEIRIDPATVDLLGRLDDMPTVGSGYVISPYVGVIPGIDGLQGDGVEVDRILTPSLAVFADPSRRRDEERVRDGVRFPVTYFDVGRDVVWGATARMLVALIALLD